MLRMFRRLGLINIIEGVETIEQSDFVQAMDIDYIQGYLFNKPLISNDVERIYNKNLSFSEKKMI